MHVSAASALRTRVLVFYVFNFNSFNINGYRLVPLPLIFVCLPFVVFFGSSCGLICSYLICMVHTQSVKTVLTRIIETNLSNDTVYFMFYSFKFGIQIPQRKINQGKNEKQIKTI